MNPKGKVLFLYILWENFLLAVDLFKGTGSILASRKYSISPTVVKWFIHKTISQTKTHMKRKHLARQYSILHFLVHMLQI